MKIAIVASECQIEYGAMGAVGFLYQSAKDSLRWHRLSPKRWIGLLMSVGRYVAMRDEDWKKSGKIKGDSQIAAALKAAFGDGKNGG